MARIPQWQKFVKPSESGLTCNRFLLGAVGLAMVGAYPGITAEFRAGTVADLSLTDFFGLPPAQWLTFAIILGLGLVLIAASLFELVSRSITGMVLASLIGLWGVVALAAELDLAESWSSGPVEHMWAYGGGTWIVLAIVVAGLLLSLRERVSTYVLCGLLLSALAIPLLVAGRYEEQQSPASALRWCLAIVAIVATSAVLFRERLSPPVDNIGFSLSASKSGQHVESLRNLLITVPAVPILALTLRYVFAIVDGRPPAGPLDETFFSRIGPVWSYAGPIVALSSLLVLCALRDRLLNYALAGSLVLQLAVCLCFTVPRWVEGTAVRFPDFVLLSGWCGLTLSLYTLAWIAARRWIEPAPPPSDSSPLELRSPLDGQLLLNIAVVLVPLLWAAAAIFIFPSHLPASVERLGNAAGYFAVLLTAASLMWLFHSARPQITVHAMLASAAGFAVLTASSMAGRNSAATWISFHVMAGGWCTIMASATVAACYASYLSRRPIRRDLG